MISCFTVILLWLASRSALGVGLLDEVEVVPRHVVVVAFGQWHTGVLHGTGGSLTAIEACGVSDATACRGHALCVATGTNKLMGVVFAVGGTTRSCHVVYLLISCYTVYNIVGGFEPSEHFINQQTIVYHDELSMSSVSCCFVWDYGVKCKVLSFSKCSCNVAMQVLDVPRCSESTVFLNIPRPFRNTSQLFKFWGKKAGWAIYTFGLFF